MHYGLLIYNTYKCITNYSIHDTFEGDVVWRFLCHNDKCGDGGWLGGSTMVDFVRYGGGIWWLW